MRRRPIVSLLVLGLAVLGLAGCRTSPDVAAYVGDAQITTGQLQSAVDDRLADPDVASYAAGQDAGAFPRQVLSLLIGERVYDAVEQRYDVDVTDAQISRRIGDLLGGEDEQTLFTQLAQQQGLTEDDAREIIRELLVREQVAQAEGLADLSDAGLQAAYEDAKQTGQQFELGYITVPDQATADAVAAQLRADPASYTALAAQYAGTYTLAAPQQRTLDQLPQVLAQPVQQTLPEGVFTLPVAETGGVLVGQVTFPPFEDLESSLTDQARQAASDAAQPLVDALRADLDVVVNPRYGSLDDGQVVEGDGGVVQILSGG
ncbi:SurA N-terminal domain-containing protein [Klenkia sp. PcliD-1-E]|uniref:SurA N-terminal domain-containing protein n=1 Tax=Klenkia sp. PcliD-1-E TaxID=2954492 RepID=UPI0020978381|nr:SurA N-terminal domain-containing protein [Klenkia sp. PcliD-1-E]MCO7221256.1 peptidylprolyl isomerase [Klenkia sp. PcliD-1-E]